MGSFEYYDTSFSYIDNETGKNTLPAYPNRADGDLISPDSLPPGAIYATSVSSGGTIGLYRIEITTAAGNGKLKLAGGGKGAMRESIKRAYNYLRANKSQ